MTTPPLADHAIAEAILTLAAARGPGQSISPNDAAAALSAEWRPLLGPVRRVAAELARQGRIDILRKGKPIAPGELHGVVRLRIRPEAPDAPDAPP